MADEDITLDGKPLQSLRVADLKAALEQRNLSKSGQKNALIKRLKGALMLESLQKSSSSHIGLQPNSQIGEEMSQNSFIKQYLAKQQELLCQRMEREAQQSSEADESPGVAEEEDDHTEDNSDKHRPVSAQQPLARAEVEGGGLLMGQGMMGRRPDMGPGSVLHHQEAPNVPGAWLQRPSLRLGHEDKSTPSPPRAIASLSVRVVGQVERQSLPPFVPRAQEKEGTAPAEPGSAHSVLHLSRSAGPGGRVQEDSDEDEDEDDEDDSDEDEEWGVSRRGGKAPPRPPQQPSPSVPPAAARSRRKLQPPQHIPPPQVHQPPMQLRHPTPPPSPPPELSFPLPDTPKQSPPDVGEPEAEGAVSRPRPSAQRQDSSSSDDSSSRSSSPEPQQERRPGPLTLLVRKMESEGASSAVDMSHSGLAASSSSRTTDSSNTPLQRMERERQQQKKEREEREKQLREEMEEERRQKQQEEDEREREKKRQEERERQRLEEEKEKEKKHLEAEREKEKKRLEEEREMERKHLEEQREMERKRVEDKREMERKQAEEERERERKRMEEKRETERKQEEEERERERKRVEEEMEMKIKRLEDERKREQKRLEENREKEQKRQEVEDRESRLPPWKRGRSGSEDSVLSPQPPKRGEHPLSSPPPSLTSITEPPAAKKTRMFSDTAADSMVSLPRTKQAVTVTKTQDSGSEYDSDSESDSSSHSTRSSSSSRDNSRPAKQQKIAHQGKEAEDEKRKKPDKGEKSSHPTKREVTEPSAAAVTEADPDSEASMIQQPASEAEPENSEGRLEESTTPKAFAARKISLPSGSKTSPVSTEGGAGGGGPGDCDTAGAAGRKRRWGSSTAVTVKKPSISITTDSLKSLIPDIKVNQEAVVELHAEELQLSGDEDSQEPDNNRTDQDKGLKIRRTVTQVVAIDNQENGQRNEEEDEEAVKSESKKQRRTSKDKRKNSQCEEPREAQSPVKHDAEAKKVTPSDSLVRRSISQQKSGVSVTIDDPVRTSRQPSPPRSDVSNIVHITNLVRPFTLGQLKELLNRTGSMVEEGFWIDKIKSHCYVTYTTSEEAVATRTALHGVKWPQSNPKVLHVDFCQQDELDFHKGLLKPNRVEEDRGVQLGGGPPTRLPPLMPERDRDRENRDREPVMFTSVRDQWAEREREMQRRERTRGEREWDRDKIREFGRPDEDGRRSRSRDRERRRRERGKSKERKTDKKEKADEPPAKLLDDLFLKTKAAPCIYWLPLTDEQAAQRVIDRVERQKERERRREEADKKRKEEEEKKERLKVRVKEEQREGGAAAPSASASGTGRGGDRDREKERERERGRDREGDKRKEGYRARGPSDQRTTAGSGRRSRSRSNARDRRR